MNIITTTECRKVKKGLNVDELNNFNNQYSDFKQKLGDFQGKYYLQGNNNNNYNQRRDNFQLPEEGYGKSKEHNVLNRKKKN